MIIMITGHKYTLPSPVTVRRGKWVFDCIIFKIRESDLAIEYMKFAFYLSLHISQVYQLCSLKFEPNEF